MFLYSDQPYLTTYYISCDIYSNNFSFYNEYCRVQKFENKLLSNQKIYKNPQFFYAAGLNAVNLRNEDES